VVDDDLTAARSIRDVNNIYYGSRLMYIATDSLGFKPVIGGNIKVDGILCQINAVTESMGIYEIVFEKYGGK